jgi:hypothetical protein
VLETEDLLEEMEALVESMERVRDGRYIAEAIVFGVVGWWVGLGLGDVLFVCMEIGWKSVW